MREPAAEVRYDINENRPPASTIGIMIRSFTSARRPAIMMMITRPAHNGRPSLARRGQCSRPHHGLMIGGNRRIFRGGCRRRR